MILLAFVISGTTIKEKNPSSQDNLPKKKKISPNRNISQISSKEAHSAWKVISLCCAFTAMQMRPRFIYL